MHEKRSAVDQFPIIRLCVHVTAGQIRSEDNFRVADDSGINDDNRVRREQSREAALV
jgi:hypothetical protein